MNKLSQIEDIDTKKIQELSNWKRNNINNKYNASAGQNTLQIIGSKFPS